VTPAKLKPRKTAEDYLKLPEGVRAELIEGEFFMSPPPKLRHQRVVSNLHLALRRFAESGNRGLVLDAPMDVYLPSGDVVQPDLVFLGTLNRALREDWIRGVPDLLIEVVSPESAERDRIVKRHLYEGNGVLEYWIVDPQKGTVEVLHASPKGYAEHGYFEESDTVTSAVLPGLSLPVREVFA
jgi:Uma2 family endonuclease